MMPIRSPGRMPLSRSQPASRPLARSRSAYVSWRSSSLTATRSAWCLVVSSRLPARFALIPPPVSTAAGASTTPIRRVLRTPGSEQAALAGAGDRLHAVAGAQLLERALEVRLHRVARQERRRRDLRVRLAERHPAQNVVLAPRQAEARQLRGRRLGR